MGVVETIDCNNFPKQYPSIGKRVQVCYKYDTSRCHEGVIVRDDVGSPGETIIKLDNGRYLRAAECQYSIKEGQAATFPETNADRIRNMTDEELAELISSGKWACICPMCEFYGTTDCAFDEDYGTEDKKICAKGVMKWLQSPVEV